LPLFSLDDLFDQMLGANVEGQQGMKLAVVEYLILRRLVRAQQGFEFAHFIRGHLIVD
jgi:hypothetical protein